MKNQNRQKPFTARDIILKNRFNSEIVRGTLVNEEDIDGKQYFVIRNDKGNFVKLTKEAFTLQK